MLQFALGLLSSLCTSAIAVGLGAWCSGAGRRWLVRWLSAVTGATMDRFYRQQQLASADLERDLAKARWVKVMAGRGSELTQETFRPVWDEAGGRLESVQVLLPDPAPAAAWLHRREQEISRYDRGYGGGLLREQVGTNIRYLTTLAAGREGIDVRVFDLPHTCRAVITDRLAYLTVYTPNKHGHISPCFVYPSHSEMYSHVLRLFTVVWNTADAAPCGSRPQIAAA
jgi:hypothetical protein